MTTEKINALLKSNYYEQIIDEACNADLGFNNHFRHTMTIPDAIEAYEDAQQWKEHAKTLE